jgi:hypothetical protein
MARRSLRRHIVSAALICLAVACGGSRPAVAERAAEIQRPVGSARAMQPMDGPASPVPSSAPALVPAGSIWTWAADVPAARWTELNDVTAIAKGAGETLALRSDGTVWALEGIESMQSSIGRNECTPLPCINPVRVTGLPHVNAIAAGGFRSMALGSDGTVWEWGLGPGEDSCFGGAIVQQASDSCGGSE